MCLLVPELSNLKLLSTSGFPHIIEDTNIVTVIAKSGTFLEKGKKIYDVT